MTPEEKYLEAVKVIVKYGSNQLNEHAVRRSFDYRIISAHNNDLYECGKWAYNHLMELGKQGYEIVKVQEMHDCGSWVLLKKENYDLSNEKFGQTGTTNAVLANIDKKLNRLETKPLTPGQIKGVIS